MKYLELFENFRVNEEIDIDSSTDNKMREQSPRMVKQAKEIQSMLKEFKFISKNVSSSDDSNKLRKEAIEKVKEKGCKDVYGIMQWSGQICQSFSIIAPSDCAEVLRIPFYSGGRKIYYNETPGKFCTLEVYNSPGGKGESKSLYMESDGEVLFQWDDYENKSKGKLSSKARQLL
jgi:hypothetical protein